MYRITQIDERYERFIGMTSERGIDFAASMGLDLLTAILVGGRDEFYDFLRTLGKEMKSAKPVCDEINIMNPLNARCQECCRIGFFKSNRALLKKRTAWPLFNNPPDPEPVDWEYFQVGDEKCTYRPEHSCSHHSPCGMAQTEEIYHAGGFAVYPCVSPKMVRFWKVEMR